VGPKEIGENVHYGIDDVQYESSQKAQVKLVSPPFADRDVGFISAVTVVDDGRDYRRRFRGGLITQREMRAMGSSRTGPTSRGRR
jgi:hypothetical protein